MLSFLRLESMMNTFIISFLSEKSIRESEWRQIEQVSETVAENKIFIVAFA